MAMPRGPQSGAVIRPAIVSVWKWITTLVLAHAQQAASWDNVNCVLAPPRLHAAIWRRCLGKCLGNVKVVKASMAKWLGK